MVNLASKYESKIAEAYTRESFFKGNFNNEYSFSGVKTVKIYTPVTVPMSDYTRSGANRYGTPVEMEDTTQELTLTQDKSFSLTIDKGNNADQLGIKPAAQMLALQLKEQAVPLYDRYVATAIAINGGIKQGYDGNHAITASNVVDRISSGTVALDEAEVPADGRTLYVTPAIYKFLRLSDEFQKAEGLITTSLTKGEVGQFDGMKVVKVPSSRWMTGINFMIVHKNAVTAPIKLSETKLHQDPPGINGNLLEGREYYDCFVIGARANGIYIDFSTAQSGGATMCATPTQSSGTFACTTSGVTFKYTNDGTDPRYSASAIVAASESESSGTEIKVCAYKAGCLTSDVLTYTA